MELCEPTVLKRTTRVGDTKQNPLFITRLAHQGSHVKNPDWAGHFPSHQEPAFHRIFYFWRKSRRPGNPNSAGNQIFHLQALLYCPMGAVLWVPDLLLLFSLVSLTRLCCSQYAGPTWISWCTRVGYTSEEHLKVLPLARPYPLTLPNPKHREEMYAIVYRGDGIMQMDFSRPCSKL